VMPGMGGRVLADTLRARQPTLRVLFMSGYTDDEVLRRGVEREAVPFLQKPLTQGALTQAVRAVLDGSRAGRGAPAGVQPAAAALWRFSN